MADQVLQDYRDDLIGKLRQDDQSVEVPHFACDAKHTSPILALLKTPSSVVKNITNECAITNPDLTSKFQRMAICKAKINTRYILFWNYYAAYNIEDFGESSSQKWSKHFIRLVKLMKKLEVIVVYGKDVEEGIRQYSKINLSKPPFNNIKFLYAPLPPQGITKENNEKKFYDAWRDAAAIIGDRL